MGYQVISLPAIFDDLNVGITLHHPDSGNILDANQQLENLYGYSSDELESMDVGDYTAPSSSFSQELAVERIRAAAGGEQQEFDWQIERANGEFRWVRVNLSPTTIDGVECVMAEISDITEYRERENLLQLVTRVIRHNLRNDMSILIGYAERLKDAIESDSLEEEVETILEVATQVGNLSSSIREIEQITDPTATSRSPIDLQSVTKDRVEQARPTYTDCKISIEGDTDVTVIADEGLEYALKHAIRNAIEHNDQETPSVSVRIEDHPEDATGRIQIIDNGPPIPQIEIDAIDEATETTSTYHGSGVGLWVMKWCVDSLGGSLTFEERSPRGNIVTISLPKALPDE